MEFKKKSKNQKYLAKTFYGLEEVLVKELEAIGASNVEAKSRAVLFEGDKEVLYKANIFCRTCLRILVQFSEGQAKSEDELYKLAYRIKWEEMFSVTNTFAIDCVVKSQTFGESKYATFKVKDAIMDRFRHESGRKPVVQFERPDVRVNVHIWDENITFYLDSSCEPLFKRGYRFESEIQPLNEVLAAGMVALSGWDQKEPLMDPMCGSGTILIEAAMIATNRVPGLYRKYYGFKNWKDFDISLYRKVMAEANEQIVDTEVKLYGRDQSRRVLSVTKKNLENAGVDSLIKLQAIPFERGVIPADTGVVVCNPPVGEEDNLEEVFELYERFGKKLEKDYQSWRVWMLCQNKAASKRIGVYADQHVTLYEGSQECWYNGYFLEQ